MALILPGPMISGVSGSIGGVTFANNRGGQYARQRRSPVNPNTGLQQARRSVFADLTSDWYDTLTNPQRLSWDLYASNVPLINSLGQPRNVGGLGMFIRTNSLRAIAGLPLLAEAPSVFNTGVMTAPVVTALNAATDQVTFTITNTDPWATETGGALIVQQGRPVNDSVNFYKSPFAVLGVVLGNTGTPPTTSQTLTLNTGLGVGQRVFFRFRAILADGRVTPEAITFRVAA
jgi:hypothetical protein